MRYIFMLTFFAISNVCQCQNSFPSTGNVGVSTTSPTSLLDIYSSNSGVKVQIRSTATNAAVMELNGTGIIGALESIIGSPTTIPTGVRVGCRSNYTFSLFSNNVNRLNVLPNGNIGIGTTVPGSYMLAVAGKIAATGEVRVFDINTTTFPDYVFAPGYKLLSLDQIELFIKQNHHLPDVPSVTDVAKDGMSFNEMNVILLKKVEELTLHLIELKKENDLLTARVRKLEEL